MFDLIGYWAVVSIITILLSTPFLSFLYLLSISFMGKVFEDKWDGKNFVHKFVDLSDGIDIKGKEVLPEAGKIILIVSGIFSWFVPLIYTLEQHTPFSDSLIRVTSIIAEALAPAGIYVAVPLVIYFGCVGLARKAIKLKAKLDFINKKLKEDE